MARRDRKKREAPISYRPPERLREEFYTRALNSGLSVNAFITAAIFGKAAPRARRTHSVDRTMLAQLLSQSARINDRLPDAPPGSPAIQVVLLKQCQDELAEIRACLLTMLGRDP